MAKQELFLQSPNQSCTPVFIFNPEKLIPLSQFFTSLTTKLPGCVAVIDCALIDSKVDLFEQVFTGLLKGVTLKLAYDFSEFASKFPVKVKSATLILKNAAQLNPSALDDLLKLWKRGCASGKLASKPKLSLILDSTALFLGMDTQLRSSFALEEINPLNTGTVFEDLLTEMTLKLPLWIGPQLISVFAEESRTATLSLQSLLRRLKLLCLLHSNLFEKQACSSSSAKIRAMLMFLRPMLSADPGAFVRFYCSILSGSLEHADCLFALLNTLKSLPPAQFMAQFTSSLAVLSAISKKLGKATLGQSAEALKAELNSSVLAPLKKVVESKTATSIDALKDAQLDTITAFSRKLISISLSIPSDEMLSDNSGWLRRAFDADPSVALQYALKHPMLYLNCNCCGSLADGPLTSETIRTRLNTVNRPCLPDTCLLYRLTIEFPSKSINLVDLFSSFSAVLSAPKSTPLLM